MKIDLCFHPRPISKAEIEKVLPEITQVMKQHGVSLAYLFGSVQLDLPQAGDLDIGVYIRQPDKSLLDYYTDLYFDLCDLLRADNIDVVMLNQVNPVFRYEVIKTGSLIYYHTYPVLEEFIEDTLFQYEEIRSLKKEYRAELHKRIKEGILMATRKLNKEKIDTLIDHMNQALDEIRFTVATITDFNTFHETKQVRELCVHYLRIVLESVLDLCRHIIAVKGLGIPDMEKQNLIDVLGISQVIPSGFARKIRGMQGLRNAIVHVYWNLDYERIYEMIKENLGDFEDFARHILEYVEKRG